MIPNLKTLKIQKRIQTFLIILTHDQTQTNLKTKIRDRVHN
jgi:hypothetical protein